ncbi:MAG: serine/threonine protein kinase [Pseudomonadales bacterium]|nr:serine/threonine protein kinase [Pseudomonadales bacterium]
MADLVGQTLGQYTITERLGRGGMADVYKAFHTELSIYRAIKVIRPEFVTSEDFQVRFQKEAQSVASLRHQNIVQIHDFGREGDTYYMVMEFIEGTDLKALLKKQGRIRPIHKALSIVTEIASALEYAHKRDLIHRDIKPDNIMINNEGVPILMDFGIAKLLTESTQLTQTGMGIGTPAYMSPEQAKATGTLGPQADIYSLSIVLFEMLTGSQPFSADTPMAVMLKAISDPLPLPRSICSDISEELEGIILKGTSKDPEQRFSSALAFGRALEGHDSVDIEQPTMLRQAPNTTPTEVLPREKKFSKGLVIGIVLVLVITAGIAGYLSITQDTPDILLSQQDSPRQTTSSTINNSPQPSNASSPTQEDKVASDGPDTGQSTVLLEYQGETEPGITLTKSIEVSKDDVLYLNVVAAKPTTDFALVSKDGRSQIFKSYGDTGPVKIKQSAQLQFSALTRNKVAGNIDYQLWKLNPAVIEGGEIQPGTFLTGETSVPGQTIEYKIDLNIGETLFFDLEKSSKTTDFYLTSVDGRTKVFKSYGDSGPLDIKKSGTYSLTADPRGDALSSFEFTLYTLAFAQLDGGTIKFGDYVSGTTDTPGQLISYKNINLEKGDVLYFDLQRASTTTDFSLLSADGRTKVFKSYADSGPLDIKKSGTYTLTADPRGDALSSFEFILHTLAIAQLDGGTIKFGDYVSGNTDTPGQLINYKNINLKKDDVLYFDLQRASTTTDFSLLSADGRTQVFKSYSSQGPLQVPKTATYTMIANPRGEALSDFEFVLHKLDMPVVNGGLINYNEYYSGATSEPGQIIKYRLEGKSGQKITIEITRASQTTDFKLMAPDERTKVFNKYSGTTEVTLQQDGTFAFFVDPRQANLSEFEFKISQ